MVREEGGSKYAVNGDFCGAAHKGCQQNGHPPVPLRGQSPGGHDGGNRAAEAHQHGYDAAAGQTNFPQQLVHDKGHTGHVSSILQNGQEEEKNHDNGQKTQYTAHSGKNTVDYQTVDHRVQAVGRESGVNDDRQSVDTSGQQVGEEGAEDIESQIEDGQHDTKENRQGQVLVGNDPVDGLAPLALSGRPAFHHGGIAYPLNEVVAHVGQSGVAVHATFGLHLCDTVLQKLQFVLVQLQPIPDIRVVLNEFGGGEADREPGGFRVVLDLMDHRMDAAVDRTGSAEIVYRRIDSVFSGVDCGADQLIHTLVFHGRDGDHRDAQRLGHAFDVDGAAVGGDFVHHVQRQYHGNAHLHQLQGQIQVPLDVGGVHDVDDAVGLLIQNEVPGDDLLRRIGTDGVNARQVHHRAVLLAPDFTGLLVHRDAGEVAHVLIGAGELVEQRGLAAVLVSGQCEDHTCFTSTEMLRASSFRRDRA